MMSLIMKLKSTVILVMTVLAGMITIFAAVNGNTLQTGDAQNKPVQDKKDLLEKGGHRGKVLSTMNSGGYTYIEFDENGKTRWVACRQAGVSVGDTIEFGQALPMKSFHSRTLKRTWEDIFFVSRVSVVNAADGKTQLSTAPLRLPEGHVPVGPNAEPKQVTIEPGSIVKAENGWTVEECYAGKNSLAGKQVTVRGKVVKFSAKIMGRNWVHIRDGSGKTGSDDLTVTSGQAVQVGDVILVTGKIAYDRDFGSGYHFPVIIEDAAVTVEETTGSIKGKNSKKTE
jgi:hypothetical protein